MKKIAYEYFSTHPWYQLNVARSKGGIREIVLKLWLKGNELYEIWSKFADSQIMVKSILACKKWIVNVAVSEVDIDNPKLTKEILSGFFDYIEEVYNECESVIGTDVYAEID